MRAVVRELQRERREDSPDFLEVPESPSLEARIFADLDYERLQKAASEVHLGNWFLLPIAECLFIGLTLGLGPRLQEAHLSRQVATLLSQPPSEEINSIDQKELLAWSAQALSGDAGLPSELSRVEFRAASSLKVASHRAVLLPTLILNFFSRACKAFADWAAIVSVGTSHPVRQPLQQKSGAENPVPSSPIVRS